MFDPVIHVGHLIITRPKVDWHYLLKRTYVAQFGLVAGIDATRVVAVYCLDIFVRHPAEQALELGIKLIPLKGLRRIAHGVVIVSVTDHEPVVDRVE